MKQILLKFLLRFIPFTLVLFFIQYFLRSTYFQDIEFYYSLPAIYLFHIIATLLIYFSLLAVFFNFKEYTGYAFMGASLLKMLAAVLFLLPMLLERTDNPFANILSFFVPYFLYLIFETIYAVKLINPK